MKKDNSYYQNLRPEIYEIVPKSANKILEIGCAAGGFRLNFIDRITPKDQGFAERFLNINVQVEPPLVPRNLDSMSFDCDSWLERSFGTRYLLIIQDNGFSLHGWACFLADTISLVHPMLGIGPSLVLSPVYLIVGRRMADSRYVRIECARWRRKYGNFNGDVHFFGEHTETLLKYEWKYNRTMKMADNRSAPKFSYDIIVPQSIKELPFGFHRAETFVEFFRRGWVNE